MVINGFRIRKHTFVLLPPGVVYSVGSAGKQPKGAFRRRRFRAPLFAGSVPIIRAGEGKTGIVTACGKVSVRPGVNLFGALSSPIVEQFDGPEGLRDQFVIRRAFLTRVAVRPLVTLTACRERTGCCCQSSLAGSRRKAASVGIGAAGGAVAGGLMGGGAGAIYDHHEKKQGK